MKRAGMRSWYREWSHDGSCRGARDLDLTRSDPPRTPLSHPYSYDPFTVWGNAGENPECNMSVYTDRMQEWDYDKYERLSRKVYPEHSRPFNDHGFRGDLVEEFMRLWYDDPKLKLLRVIKYCNQSTGYPTWRLDFVTTKEA